MNRKKITIGFCFLLALVLALSGCQSKNQTADAIAQDAGEQAMPANAAPVEVEADYAPAPASAGMERQEMMEEQGLTGQELSITSDDQRKLIKDVTMDVETKEFDTLLSSLNQRVTELGGYIQVSEVNGNSYQYQTTRQGYLVARIPTDKLEGFISQVNDMGNVVSKRESVEDVTLNYVDIQSKIKALKTEQETLMQLLEKAESLEDIIKIQSRLTEVRYELESNESQIRTLDNLITYSTVTINIYEVEQMTPVEDKGAWEQMKTKFAGNLRAIANGGRTFIIWLVSSIPYLILLALAVVVVLIVVRLALKKRKGKVKPEKEPENKSENKSEKEKNEQE